MKMYKIKDEIMDDNNNKIKEKNIFISKYDIFKEEEKNMIFLKKKKYIIKKYMKI